MRRKRNIPPWYVRFARRRLGRYRSGHFVSSPQPLVPIQPIEGSFDVQAELSDAGSEPVVVSYGTRDGRYDRFAQRLREGIDALGGKADIDTIPAMPRLNASLFKPSFIKMKLLVHGQTLLWLDGDSVLERRVSLPGGAWDLGFLDNNLPSEVNAKASLAIAVRPTIPALRFLETWEQLCSQHWATPGMDHEKMNIALMLMGNSLSVIDLRESMKGALVRDFGRDKEFRY